MKVEITDQKPEFLKETWPGQYEVFSHFEYISAVPSILFIISTLKENGKPNACFHAWSAFAGDGGGYFSILPGVLQPSHTYKNILREGEFCVNFLAPEYYDACIKTIKENELDTDEFLAGGFTAEAARCVKPPRIKEAFMVYECKLESHADLSGKGISSLIVGRVVHAAIEEHHSSVEGMCAKTSFMFNLHRPKDPRTGEGEQSALAQLHLTRLVE